MASGKQSGRLPVCHNDDDNNNNKLKRETFCFFNLRYILAKHTHYNLLLLSVYRRTASRFAKYEAKRKVKQ